MSPFDGAPRDAVHEGRGEELEPEAYFTASRHDDFPFAALDRA
jgi:hypothetical protein